VAEAGNDVLHVTVLCSCMLQCVAVACCSVSQNFRVSSSARDR